MGRSLEEIMDTLPAKRRHKVEARGRELIAEAENLKAVRQIMKRSQTQMAKTLGIKQPSVHKIEQQTDMYLSTLRKYVEAAGGTLELRVDLPGKGVVDISELGLGR